MEKKKGCVAVFKQWSNKKIYLSTFMEVNDSTSGKWSSVMQDLHRYNLLYVVQSVADRENHIYKIGVSKGVGRLYEYVKHHGNPTSANTPQYSKCTGVFLVYLAGKKRHDSSSRKTTAGKADADIVDYYRHTVWSQRKEQHIFWILNTQGILPVRGKEWFHIKDADLLKHIVTTSTGALTRETQATENEKAFKESILLPTDRVLEVVEGFKEQRGEHKGQYVYMLRWSRAQLETLTAKNKNKKREMTPYTVEPLRITYKEMPKRNLVRRNMGNNIIKLVHNYIVANNLTTKDSNYKPNMGPGMKSITRSSSVQSDFNN